MKNLKIAYLISLLVSMVSYLFIFISNEDTNQILTFIFVLIILTSSLLTFLIFPLWIIYSKTKSLSYSIFSFCFLLINILLFFDVGDHASISDSLYIGLPILYLILLLMIPTSFIYFYKSYEKFKGSAKYLIPGILVIVTYILTFSFFSIDYTDYQEVPTNLVLPGVNGLLVKFPFFLTLVYITSIFLYTTFIKLTKNDFNNILLKIWDGIFLFILYIIIPAIIIYEIIITGELATFTLFIKQILFISIFNILIPLILSLINDNRIKYNKNQQNIRYFTKMDIILFSILIIVHHTAFLIITSYLGIFTFLFPIVEFLLYVLIVYKLFRKDNLTYTK